MNILLVLFLVLYSSFCFLVLPLRAWKKEYKKLSIFLSVTSVFFITFSIVGFLGALQGEDFGFVVFVPAVCLYVQFIFYLICKFILYINKPRLIVGIDK